jgi:iron(III) transport system permease protein
MARFDTFTTAIFDQFQSTFNGPAANMLAGDICAPLPRASFV